MALGCIVAKVVTKDGNFIEPIKPIASILLGVFVQGMSFLKKSKKVSSMRHHSLASIMNSVQMVQLV